MGDTVWDTADTMVDTTVWDTVDTTAADTDTVMAADTDMVDTTTVDTMAMDTDTVTDTDIMVKLLLKLQLLSHISSPIIELSINQKTTAPPPYKKRKIFGSTEEISFFKKHLV